MVAAGQWRNLSSSCRRRIARHGRDRRWMRSVRKEDYGQTVMKTGSEKPDRADGASSASKRVGSGPQTSIMARGISAASEAGHTSAPDRMHMSYPKTKNRLHPEGRPHTSVNSRNVHLTRQ